jgi:hypothetical protein
MIEKCFNCGEDIDDEVDTYAKLVGVAGIINFCEICGEGFSIPNWHNQKVNFIKDSLKERDMDITEYIGIYNEANIMLHAVKINCATREDAYSTFKCYLNKILNTVLIEDKIEIIQLSSIQETI